MRPCQINPFLVDVLINALAGGLTIRECAAIAEISDRTLYQWLADGRNLWILCELGDLKRDELHPDAQEKLRLYEERRPEIPDFHKMHIKIDNLIGCKQIDKEWSKRDRDRKKQLRKAREKERNKLRAKERRYDRMVDKYLKSGKLKKQIDYVQNFTEDFSDPWK